MRLRWVVACIASCCIFAPAIAPAAERKLAGAEIEALLAGNTVDGQVVNGRSLQYFDRSGATTYQEPGGRPSEGRWVDGDKYCSQWPPAESWACYDVEGDAAAAPPTITWIGESGTRYPGIVLQGRKP